MLLIRALLLDALVLCVLGLAHGAPEFTPAGTTCRTPPSLTTSMCLHGDEFTRTLQVGKAFETRWP